MNYNGYFKFGYELLNMGNESNMGNSTSKRSASTWGDHEPCLFNPWIFLRGETLQSVGDHRRDDAYQQSMKFSLMPHLKGSMTVGTHTPKPSQDGLAPLAPIPTSHPLQPSFEFQEASSESVRLSRLGHQDLLWSNWMGPRWRIALILGGPYDKNHWLVVNGCHEFYFPIYWE